MVQLRMEQTPAIDAVAARGRTAMRRYTCSRPIALLLADGLLTKDTSVLDYGCGHGTDVKYLSARGIRTTGWDPVHNKKGKLAPADVVNLGFVLNVIENPRERAETLKRAFGFARRLLVVAVRVDRTLEDAEGFGDGCLTATRTFQKLYTPSELREYVEEVLGGRLHLAALGIGYIFRDEEAEARYLATRAFTRRLEFRTDLIEEFGKNPIARRYVRLANKLGRPPIPEEFKDYSALLEAFGSVQRVERLLLSKVNHQAFEGSRTQRREDILTFLATLRLQNIRPPSFQALPTAIRADIRGLWRSYAAALAEGERFLFSIADPARIREAAAQARVGKLLPDDIYVHRSAEDDLPALLRLLTFAAKHVVGTLTYDVVKIAMHGRAVSFLRYSDFDQKAHPELELSVRVYLPKADFQVRDYRDSQNPPILHRKETLVSSSYPFRPTFEALTGNEVRLGLLSAPDIGYRQGWEALLSARGITISAHDISVASTPADYGIDTPYPSVPAQRQEQS